MQNPYYLLNQINREENVSMRGKLKIFFGYAAGVGKSYKMLVEAHSMKKLGKDVVIGYIESYERAETMELLQGIECIKYRNINYKGIALREFDLDKALLRKPQIILVDELAHTNIYTKRHKKRWQDIDELLKAGIDVYTTLNVQNIEGLKDIVESITHIRVRETIPDKIFYQADKIELIDIEPEELLKRFSDGKIYSKEQVQRAFNNFFTMKNLCALREIALRRIADKVSIEVESSRLSKREIDVIPTSDPILACIGSDTYSSKIIRTAARMARAYHSKWIALYVETTKTQNISIEEKENLTANFDLVEQLSGEIVTLYGDNIAQEIIEYAKFRNVTKILIGRNYSNRRRIFCFYPKDIVNQIIDSNLYFDVYVIPNSKAASKKKWLKYNINTEFKISFKETLISGLIMIIATIISNILYNLKFSEANLIMIFILAVMIVYINTTGYILGVGSSVVGILAFNYLFTEPRYSFQFYDKSYYATFPIMLIVSFIIGTLTNKIQREARNSSAREKRTEVLYRVSGRLLSAAGAEEVVNIGIKYISRLLERTTVCYLINENKLTKPAVYNFNKFDKNSMLLSEDEKAVAYWTLLNGKESGAGTNTFYGAKGYYMPLKSQGKILGVIGIFCAEGILEPEQKFIFETIASEISIALHREILDEMEKKSNIQIESERLRSNLLRSISHDLRSPLAGIKGAVSTIIENGKLISNYTKEELLQGIYNDTEWLIRLVENLLSMTKLDEGKVKIKKNMELVEEVVYESVSRISKSSKGHNIKVDVPENVIMAPMDGNLIEQVLINLIDNALKFTPKGSLIEIKAYEKKENICFEVIDNGIGIPEEILPHIFTRFFTNGSKISDSRRGVGLGLAICKSIVEAHDGVINAYNNELGGATFRFCIPKGENDG